MTGELAELKKILKKGRIVIGTVNTLKKLKAGRLEKIFLSSNIPSEVRNDILHYSKLTDVKIIELSIPNDEFGVQMKKQFAVSVAGVLKEEN